MTTVATSTGDRKTRTRCAVLSVMAQVFVAANALIANVSYFSIVGTRRRVEFTKT